MLKSRRALKYIMDIQYDNYENMKENLLLTLFIPEFFAIEKLVAR